MKLFELVLKAAMSGSQDDFEKLYLINQKLIHRHSKVDGRLEVDLLQEQLIMLWKIVTEFDFNRVRMKSKKLHCKNESKSLGYDA